MFRSRENENKEVENAGPSALAIETVVCARPLVAPRDLLFGADAVTYIKIVPYAMSKKAKEDERTRIRSHTKGDSFPNVTAAVLIAGKEMKIGIKVDMDKTNIFLTPK